MVLPVPVVQHSPQVLWHATPSSLQPPQYNTGTAGRDDACKHKLNPTAEAQGASMMEYNPTLGVLSTAHSKLVNVGTPHQRHNSAVG